MNEGVIQPVVQTFQDKEALAKALAEEQAAKQEAAQPTSVPLPDIRPLLDDDLKVLVPAACRGVGDLATVVQIQFLRDWRRQNEPKVIDWREKLNQVEDGMCAAIKQVREVRGW